MQGFECAGLWRLPGEDAAVVAGTLRVRDNGSLDLSLDSVLGSSEEPFETKKHSIILGTIPRCPFGHIVTLTQCIATAMEGIFDGAREDYRATRAFFGAHLDSFYMPQFARLAVRLGGLNEWTHSLSGIQTNWFHRLSVGESATLVTYTRPAPIKVQVAGVDVTLYMGFSSKGSIHHGVSFREEAQFEIRIPSPMTEAELSVKYVYPFRHLMTFVCDRPQEVERVNVWQDHDDVVSNNGQELRVIGRQIQPYFEPEDSKPLNRLQMLFTLNDIEFGDFIGKWLRLTEVFSDVCNIYFGLQYGPPTYLDTTFLHVTQALSLYYMRRTNGSTRRDEEESRLKSILSALSTTDGAWITDRLGVRPYPPFHDVLRELVEEHRDAMNPLISNRMDDFIKNVTNSLHYAVRRDSIGSLMPSEGADLYWMIERLRFLMKSCFLREAGFSGDKAQQLFDRNALYQRVCEIEAGRKT